MELFTGFGKAGQLFIFNAVLILIFSGLFGPKWWKDRARPMAEIAWREDYSARLRLSWGVIYVLSFVILMAGNFLIVFVF